MNEVTKLTIFRKKVNNRVLKRVITKIIYFLGADIPVDVCVGEGVEFCHNALGTVIHPNTIIGNDVSVYQNVTIGKARVKDKKQIKIIIEEGAVLCAGSKILAKDNLVVGKNTIIAANSVLLKSTGENEVWGGIPARRLK
ncbi:MULTISPECIES: hypothetical protein [Clostridium]|uniref:Serine acetyltransferase n=1 Tax=Clostridium disporicum TaxID=84024 RepID=A0A174IAF2_9CLOT|nr:hypothetical protein [Clostridium disporicum]CUO84173.1 serine acetyltransferase [Clostridium disporicum]